MTKKIIGYGSLLSQASLERTCPHSSIEKPVWVHDWCRNGELPARQNASSDQPFTVMNIEAQKGAGFNAVLLSIAEEGCPALQQRESNYEAVTPPYSDRKEQPPVSEAMAWVAAGAERMQPCWDQPTQWQYVLTCLQGARETGEAFLRDFLDSTWMDGTYLSQHPRKDKLLKRLAELGASTGYGFQASPQK